MKTKIGVIYAFSNQAWFQYKKMGRTTQTTEKRISNMQTSLLDKIELINKTNILIDTYFYEYLLKLILKNYRIRTNKEMYDVDNDDIEIIFNFFNELNNTFDTQEKLNLFIQKCHPEYNNKKRKYIKIESSSSDKPKRKRRRLFVDTSY